MVAHDPDADPRVAQEQLFALLTMAGLVRHQQPLPAVLPVPHELLPVLMGRDVEADREALRTGTWRADSIALQRYGEWLGEITRKQFGMLVMNAIGELIQVSSSADLEALLERRPELLSDEADDLLRAFQAIADEEAPPEYQRQVEYWRHLIRLCRRDGVAQTFRRVGDS
ncbi:hypothetical protein ACFV80_39775 [Streptomyces sp. NPDC059862]|uniref:hypothetical protein n=1 Tax=Streptomyces sp. NPDC059862 TaxID=3346975 RepID=UPI003650909C